VAGDQNYVTGADGHYLLCQIGEQATEYMARVLFIAINEWPSAIPMGVAVRKAPSFFLQ